jgi:hypothetical protein
LQVLQQAMEQAAAAKQEADSQQEQLAARMEELGEAKASLKEQLKQAQADLADVRGQLEMEGYQRGLAESREKQQATELQEVEARLRDKSAELDSRGQQLEVGRGAWRQRGPLPIKAACWCPPRHPGLLTVPCAAPPFLPCRQLRSACATWRTAPGSCTSATSAWRRTSTCAVLPHAARPYSSSPAPPAGTLCPSRCSQPAPTAARC